MKNRLTVNRLALGNLKMRKKQYAIMIIGVILAMIFSSSIMLFMASASETDKNNIAREYGRQDCIVNVVGYGYDDYSQLVSDGVLDEFGLAHIQGFAYSDEEYKQNGTCVGWLDDRAMALSNHELIDGAMPKGDNEIAIEKRTLLSFGYNDAKVGDTIELKYDIKNGSEYGKTISKQFKITGILLDKAYAIKSDGRSTRDNDFIVSILVSPDTPIEAGGREDYCAYANINRDFFLKYKKSLGKEGRYTTRESALDNYLSKAGVTFSINECAWDSGIGNYLEFESISSNSGYLVVLAIVLLIASCIIVSSAFGTNLKERKKQIGMLRAVGTTKKQIFKIFGREALIISAIATPVSIAVSYGVVALLLRLLSKNAVMSKSLSVLPVCAIVNITVVMLSALIPLYNASKITPIQAIRNISNTRKVKTKHIKNQKEYNPSSLIAKRNSIFYKSSKRVVTAMLIITIAGTSLGASFVSGGRENAWSFAYDYLIENIAEGEFDTENGREVVTAMSEADKQSIEALPYVDYVDGVKSESVYCEVDTSDRYKRVMIIDDYCDTDIKTAEDFRNNFQNDIMNPNYRENEEEQKKLFGSEYTIVPLDLQGYDVRRLATLKDKLIDGEINFDKLASGEEIILAAPQRVQRKVSFYKGGYSSVTLCDKELERKNYSMKTVADEKCTYKVGDTIKFSIANIEYDDGNSYFSEPPKTIEAKIGAIVSPNYIDFRYGFCTADLSNNFVLVTSLQGFNHITPGHNYKHVCINTNIDIDDETDIHIMDDLTKYQTKYSAWIDSNYRITHRQSEDIKAMSTTMLAIAILCFAICSSVVNNTISARIRENKRVIGTLRAVGADEKELVKSYFLEMISMIGTGIVSGYCAYLLLMGIIRLVCNIFGSSNMFNFNPWISVVMTIMLVIVCTVNLWLKVRNEMKNSIVDNIREL